MQQNGVIKRFIMAVCQEGRNVLPVCVTSILKHGKDNVMVLGSLGMPILSVTLHLKFLVFESVWPSCPSLPFQGSPNFGMSMHSKLQLMEFRVLVRYRNEWSDWLWLRPGI